jgi:hypothetical protein
MSGMKVLNKSMRLFMIWFGFGIVRVTKWIMIKETLRVQLEHENITFPKVTFVFGNHDYVALDSSILSEEGEWKAFFDDPKTNWTPEVLDKVLEQPDRAIMSIDGLGGLTEDYENNPNAYFYYLRHLLVATAPFMEQNNRLDLVLVDPLIHYAISEVLGTDASEEVVEVYRDTMHQQRIRANLSDLGGETTRIFVTLALSNLVISQLKYQEKQPLSSMSRRSFLKLGVMAVGSWGLTGAGSLISGRITGQEGLSLSQDQEVLSLKISEILYPHLNIRPITDGRTALIYSATAEYSKESGENAIVLLGSGHQPFADRIMSDKSFRIERIQALYREYTSLITTIATLVQSPISVGEAQALARAMMIEIDVATIVKPSKNELQVAFENPQNFVNLNSEVEISEISEALSKV